MEFLPDTHFMERSVWIFFKTMKFICFMGVGSLISYVYQRKMRKESAVILGSALVGLYGWHVSFMGDGEKQWKELVSYGLALVFFIGCYRLNGKFSNKGILVPLGTLSYSLYLVHGVPGFIMMYWMMDWGHEVSILTAIAYSFFAANVFYWLVEKRMKRKVT
jgi:peptidoglycan/LPS O-acetylase OafA/YrhL